jgi:hypothetical protein
MICRLLLAFRVHWSPPAATTYKHHQSRENEEIVKFEQDTFLNLSGSLVEGFNGAGLHTINCHNVILLSCNFVTCGTVGASSRGGAFWGGGTFLVFQANDTTFDNCFATSGGGTYFGAPCGAISFTRCRFVGQKVWGASDSCASAVFVNASGSASFVDTQFANSSANGTGTVYFDGSLSWSSVTFSGCSFSVNSAFFDGGLRIVNTARCRVQHTVFEMNAADERSASLCLENVSTADIDACNFTFAQRLQPETTSVVLNGTEHVRFAGSYFNAGANPAGGAVAHIYAAASPDINFFLPMCFDLSRQRSVEFVGGEIPTDENMFNCTGDIPQGPTVTGTMPFTESNPLHTRPVTATKSRSMTRPRTKTVAPRSQTKSPSLTRSTRLATPTAPMTPERSTSSASESETLPSESEISDSQSEIPPTPSQIVPTESQILPTESQILPTESQILPTPSVFLSTESQVLPTESKISPPGPTPPSESRIWSSDPFLSVTSSSVSPAGLNENTIIAISVGSVLLVVIVVVVVFYLVRKRLYRRSRPGVEKKWSLEEPLVSKDLSRSSNFYI